MAGYAKVTICGINTSEIKTISEKEKLRLLKLSKGGNKSARESLIKGNLRLVLSIVQRFAGRGENMDDLFQIGCIGLIKAIDNFDISQKVRFSTYAVPMIIGEIRRHLRDNSALKVSRSMKDTAYHAMKARENFISEHGKEPTVEELASEIGVKKESIVLSLESVSCPISLNEPVFLDNSGDTVYVMDQVGDKNDDMQWINAITLKQEIQKLTPREKAILRSRFLKGKTQTEVADELKISQAQVSRIEKSTLKKIKEC